MRQSFSPNYDLLDRTRTEDTRARKRAAAKHREQNDRPSNASPNLHASFLALSVDCSRLHSVFPRTLSTASVLNFSMWRMDPRGRSHNTKDTIFLRVSDNIARHSDAAVMPMTNVLYNNVNSQRKSSVLREITRPMQPTWSNQNGFVRNGRHGGLEHEVTVDTADLNIYRFMLLRLAGRVRTR